MKKKYFTMIEVVIVVVVVGILATVGVPVYQNIIDKARADVCATNQQVLLGALDAFGHENYQLPASLSELRQKDIERAWAKVFEQKGAWRVKLAYFIVDFDQRGLVYAQGAWVSRYIGALEHLTCPSDPTPPPAGFSYGLNNVVIGMDYNAYLAYQAANPDVIIIGDCNAANFADIANLNMRHHVHKILATDNYAIGITPGDGLYAIEEDGDATAYTGTGGGKSKGKAKKKS